MAVAKVRMPPHEGRPNGRVEEHERDSVERAWRTAWTGGHHYRASRRGPVRVEDYPKGTIIEVEDNDHVVIRREWDGRNWHDREVPPLPPALAFPVGAVIPLPTAAPDPDVTESDAAFAADAAARRGVPDAG
jgi:hypothetical protein